MFTYTHDFVKNCLVLFGVFDEKRKKNEMHQMNEADEIKYNITKPDALVYL